MAFLFATQSKMYSCDAYEGQRMRALECSVDESRVGLLEDFDSYLSEKIKVKRLKYKDVPRAAKSLVDAIQDDPIYHYIKDTPDARKLPPRLQNRLERLEIAISLRQQIRAKIAFTVDHGRAAVCAVPAASTANKSRKDRQLDRVYRILLGAINLVLRSKQQRARAHDLAEKTQKLTEDFLGEEEREMRYIAALGTSPQFQGRGYGGALVDLASKLADNEGRATYLHSSNINNTEFYNSHGYFTIGETTLGEDDPTWNKPPVVLPLMVRPYPGPSYIYSDKV